MCKALSMADGTLLEKQPKPSDLSSRSELGSSILSRLYVMIGALGFLFCSNGSALHNPSLTELEV
jgi:hypothetical protein